MDHHYESRAVDWGVLIVMGALFLSLTGGGMFLMLLATNVLP